ncbi:SMI1/KNR4 family protein [Streptomyces hilarionis]|uniref:SMI1/KNR4 family protein n=1 Tax=Streptomyces hilarionis TaxID=2839954 RepID=UPI00211A99A7|nr:SMI1/KNR4 family protein [Streptomyces hilarionis]MCQ9133116.1 SMI1/KNR4 family protein [Streptomyces hilarionis]
MHVEIEPTVRDAAARLGGGVPYALKALAGRLADEPDMGRPSGLPGILSVTVDGDMFEDCPDLSVGYVREPDRLRIRFLRPVRSPGSPTAAGVDTETGPDTSGEGREPGRASVPSADPATAALTVRQVADAWHRITDRLRHHAPASYAALRAGASPAALAALEADLDVPLPVELRALWLLTCGDDGGGGPGCLPGNRVLMSLDAVAATYRRERDFQAREDARDAGRPEDERITVWKASRIPVVALGPFDTTSGLYLDAATGHLGRWSRFGDEHEEELDTLVTYLEETADMLEAPALATRDRPGLIDGTLVWLSGVDPAQEDRWRPLTG